MAKVIFDDALKGAYSDFNVEQASEATVDYKQVTTLGVESLVAAVFGVLGFFWTPFILASLLGLILGILAQRKIMKAPEEISGGAMTTIAVALSAVLLVSSVAWKTYAYFVSAPPGYQILPFDDMALTKDGAVADEIAMLDGHKVYIQGYMYPTKQHAGIESFTLVRTLGYCQYCSPGTNPADMIAVQMERGQSVKYKANKLVAVGGVLTVNPNWRDQPGTIPYSIKASVFR